MKLTLPTCLALLAAVLLAGVIWIARPQPKGKPESRPRISRTPRLHNTEASRTPSVPAPQAEVDRERAEADSAVSEAEARLREIAKGVAVSDIPDALRFLQEQEDSEEVRRLTVLLARQWAESDVRAASDWAEHVAAGEVRPEAIKGVAIIWSEQDLAAAVRWVQQLPAGEEMDVARKSVAYEAARTEPLVALDMACDLPGTPERDDLVQYAALQWAGTSPEEAASWANELTDAVLRERVLSHVATAWGERDPVSAAQLAVEQMPPGKPQNDAVIGIVQRWAQKDSSAATDWVMTFPEGDLFATAAENIIQLSPDPMP